MIVLLLISVVLVVGLGVFDIVLGEIILSIAGRESQKSLYAADSGIECALYWDLKHPALEQSAFNYSSYSINCAGSIIPGNMVSSSTSFKLNFGNGACAQVTVNKTNPIQTVLTSRGYNINCDSTDSRKVERAMRNAY